MKSKRLIQFMVTAAALSTLVENAHAATITNLFKLDTLFADGSTAPSDKTPWLTLSATDISKNVVKLTFDTPGLIGTEYVDSWFLNFGAATTGSTLSGKLSFTNGTVSPTSPGITIPTVSNHELVIGRNNQEAGSDIKFDIMLDFIDSKASHQFNAGEKLTYTVTYTGTGSFDASSFDIGSEKGKLGPFTTVAHIGGIPNSCGENGGSAWIAATQSTSCPEPSAGVLSMLTATACVFARKRRDLMA
jgi:hypothetical protein